MSNVNFSVNGRGRSQTRTPEREDERGRLIEKVIFINRCAKVVKGGRRFSFSALVVVGDGAGRGGVGLGKAKETPNAVKKAVEQAKKNLRSYPLAGHTIPHDIVGVSDGGMVMLKPAAPGTGIVAGGGVRLILEALGITDILSKSMGSNNPFAMVRATFDALDKLRSYGSVMSLRFGDRKKTQEEIS
ncbi:MAG: 30S ribosomal protein S5 [Puniceicoccales bacterium]|jgi:small subunit ribosomal protein S5|nr:30S ribosomal protein S5 [Puniceicoccales bacterium]